MVHQIFHYMILLMINIFLLHLNIINKKNKFMIMIFKILYL